MSFLKGLNHGRTPVKRKLPSFGKVLESEARKYQPKAYDTAKGTYKRVSGAYKRKGSGYVAGRVLSSASKSLFGR